MVLLVGLEVLREVVDALRKQSDLHLRRPRVGVMQPKPADDSRLLILRHRHGWSPRVRPAADVGPHAGGSSTYSPLLPRTAGDTSRGPRGRQGRISPPARPYSSPCKILRASLTSAAMAAASASGPGKRRSPRIRAIRSTRRREPTRSPSKPGRWTSSFGAPPSPNVGRTPRFITPGRLSRSPGRPTRTAYTPWAGRSFRTSG